MGVVAPWHGADGSDAHGPHVVKLNQRDGFRLPGVCVAGNSGHRKHAAFCENGAKAVVEEAITRTVGPGFFATHSVAELGRHRILVGTAGPADASDGAAARGNALGADRLGRPVHNDRHGLPAIASPGTAWPTRIIGPRS